MCLLFGRFFWRPMLRTRKESKDRTYSFQDDDNERPDLALGGSHMFMRLADNAVELLNTKVGNDVRSAEKRLGHKQVIHVRGLNQHQLQQIFLYWITIGS
jgi:hypothetical protein